MSDEQLKAAEKYIASLKKKILLLEELSEIKDKMIELLKKKFETLPM